MRLMIKQRQLAVALFICSLPVWAGENAAPSSHFVFDDNFEGDILINEVRVPQNGEALYTYYEALGWRGRAAGYAGIQAHPRAHNYLFSIWDHKSHRAPIVAVYRGPGTLTEKFGGEGTGLKSWNFDLGWKTDTWYTLVARSWPMEDHTYYGFWSRSGETREWTHLVTMDVATKDAYFQGGTDAFIEDWLETGVKTRTTNLRGGWKRKRDGTWFSFGSGRYSVNAWDLDKGKRSFNFRSNWNGGVAKDATGEFYFMTAGGTMTKPATANPSTHSIVRTEKRPDYAPIRVEKAKARARLGPDGTFRVDWEPDLTTTPQFSCTIAVFEKPEGEGKLLAKAEITEPHAREAILALPGWLDREKIHVQLRYQDILGNESQVLLDQVGEM